jgi:GNAT superfamily N-acetyltransferase
VEAMTMVELPEDRFERLIPLFNRDQPHGTWIFSTLEGKTLGKAFVDDPSDPQQCFLTLNFLNVTCPSDAIDQEWLNQGVIELHRKGAVTLNWTLPVAGRLQCPPTLAVERDCLDFHARSPDAPQPIPQAYQLRHMDEELLMRCLWVDALLTAYGTIENFLRHGFGLCLMLNDEICCEAYATFFDAGIFDLGVVTHESHRRQGLATLTCQHLIELCEKRGYSTSWSCYADNLASVACAKKLGYRQSRAYQWLQYS